MAIQIPYELQPQNLAQSVKQLDQFTKAAVDSVKRVESGFAKFATGLPGLLAGAFAGVSFSAIVKAAEEQESAINQLNVALKANGNFTAAASEELITYAANLQKTSKVGDEVTIANLALLQSLAPLTKDGLKAANTAAVNLSAALKIDLESAVRLVGKAANGNVEAFKRYGVELQKGTNDAETFSKAIAVINQRFGGAAAAELNTYAGATAQLGNAFSDVLEELGTFVIQNSLVIDGTKAATEALTGYAEALKASRDGNLQNTSVLNELHRQANDNAEVFQILNATYVQNAGLADQLSIADAELARQQQLVSDSLPDFFGQSNVDSFTKSLQGTANSFSDVAKEIGAIGPLLQKQVGLSDDAKKKLEEQLKTVRDGLKDAGLNAFEVIARQGAERINTINVAFRNGIIRTEKERADLQEKNQKKIIDDVSKAQKEADEKRVKELRDSIQIAAQNPFNLVITNKGSDAQVFASAAGTLGQVVKGAQGAVDLIANTVGAVANTILPGIGSIVGEITKALAVDPDEFRKNIEGFFGALPKTIGNILINSFNFIPDLLKQIPALFLDTIKRLPGILLDTFVNSFVELFVSIVDIVADLPTLIADRLPDLIERLAQGLITAISRLADSMPQVAQAFANAMPGVAVRMGTELVRQVVPIAISFIDALIKEAPRFITELVKALPSAFGGGSGGILSGISGGFGSAFSGVGDLFGFASGGQIPAGFPNDSFLMKATSNELVIPPGDTGRLSKLLDGQAQRDTALAALQQQMTKLTSLISQGGVSGAITLTANVNVGEENLAAANFNTRRQGFREATA